ncbi:MAG: Rho termination factor N-terminal domain-containing protein, partial [Propionibacteriales bacterium]|nr:Rho termination factor N-terminal domain-containing protein [Propionibacteriales bacterium]
MTETFEATPSAPAEASAETASRTKSGGLNSILLPELKQLAGSLGIKGAGAMRKGALIEAISAARSGNSSAGTNSAGSNSAGTNSAATSPAMVTATVASSPEQTAAPSESSLPAEPATSASSTRGHRADNGQPIGDVRS